MVTTTSSRETMQRRPPDGDDDDGLTANIDGNPKWCLLSFSAQPVLPFQLFFLALHKLHFIIVLLLLLHLLMLRVQQLLHR